MTCRFYPREVYLASPFSNPDPAIRRERYDRVSELTVALLKTGRNCFSPIAFSFHLAEQFDLCGSWAFWEKLDIDFLDRCDELWVYMLAGWEISVGLNQEVEHAEKTGKPITFVTPSQ